MGSAEVLLSLKKGGVCLLFLCIAVTTSASQAAASDEPNQRQFENGVAQMFAGRYEQAVATFEDLYRRTGSLRVKLEWARAAFFWKRYELSRRLFDEVLAHSVPEVVRFNVSLYLAEIAKLGNHTDYGFSFTRDTNPFTLSKPQEVLIFGLPFRYSPPEPRRTLAGITFYGIHSRALNESGNIRFIGEITDTEYEGMDRNKSALKVALQFKRRVEDEVSLRVGIDHFFQRRERLLIQRFLAAELRRDQPFGLLDQYQLEMKLTSNRYPDFPQLDGHQRSLAAVVVKNIDAGIQLGANLYADTTSATLSAQAYRTEGAGGYVRFLAAPIRSNTRIGHTRLVRTYSGVDELFMIRRSDVRDITSISIKPYAWKIADLFPAIELGFERSRSSISINTFDRAFLNFSLSKNY